MMRVSGLAVPRSPLAVAVVRSASVGGGGVTASRALWRAGAAGWGQAGRAGCLPLPAQALAVGGAARDASGADVCTRASRTERAGRRGGGKGARGTPVTLAAEAANAHRPTAAAWTRPMCDRHDGRKMGSVRGVLRQGAGIDGRVGATEVARLAGISLRDADAVRIDHARLVVARCHDDLRVRVRAATGVENDFAADRATPAIGETLDTPTGRAASDALPASHTRTSGTASVQNGGWSPVRRARVRAGAAAPRPSREHGDQAHESQLEGQKMRHARQESTLRAQPSARTLPEKCRSVCAASCRTLTATSCPNPQHVTTPLPSTRAARGGLHAERNVFAQGPGRPSASGRPPSVWPTPRWRPRRHRRGRSTARPGSR